MPNKIKKMSDIIVSYSEKLQFFEKTNALSVYDSWSAIVGEKIAPHCRLIDITHDTALIETDHTGWSQQLLLQKKGILYQFKKKYPQLGIKDIAVVVSDSYKEPSGQGNKAEKKEETKAANEEPVVLEEKELSDDLKPLFAKLKQTIIENEKK